MTSSYIAPCNPQVMARLRDNNIVLKCFECLVKRLRNQTFAKCVKFYILLVLYWPLRQTKHWMKIFCMISALDSRILI